MQNKDRCLKIGILSDSHSKLDLARFCIEKLKKEGASFLIHAGDIVLEDTLKLLKKSSLPYKAILGNNDKHLSHLGDKYELFSEPYYFKIENIKVKLMHHPYFLEPDADLIINGHTHYYEAKLTKKAFYINPGEVCARKKNLCECALLDVKKTRYLIKRFTCKPQKLKWKEEQEEFRR